MNTADKNSYGWLIQEFNSINKLLRFMFSVFVIFFLNSAKASKSAVMISDKRTRTENTSFSNSPRVTQL